MATTDDLQQPDPGRTILVPALPSWIKDWSDIVWSGSLSADDPGELIREFGEQSTMQRLLADPNIARSLAAIFQDLSNSNPIAEAQRRVLSVIAHACIGHHFATRRTFESRIEIQRAIRALVKSSRRLAGNIQLLSAHFRAADALPYLEDLIAHQAEGAYAVLRRAGLRGDRYLIGNRLRLHQLLERFAADLEAQLAMTPKPRAIKEKQAGKFAVRNYQIDYLVRQTHAALGFIPFALVANMISIANGIDVDESVVRKRPVVQKMSPKKPVARKRSVGRKISSKKR